MGSGIETRFYIGEKPVARLKDGMSVGIDYVQALCLAKHAPGQDKANVSAGELSREDAAAFKGQLLHWIHDLMDKARAKEDTEEEKTLKTLSQIQPLLMEEAFADYRAKADAAARAKAEAGAAEKAKAEDAAHKDWVKGQIEAINAKLGAK